MKVGAGSSGFSLRGSYGPPEGKGTSVMPLLLRAVIPTLDLP